MGVVVSEGDAELVLSCGEAVSVLNGSGDELVDVT